MIPVKKRHNTDYGTLFVHGHKGFVVA